MGLTLHSEELRIQRQVDMDFIDVIYEASNKSQSWLLISVLCEP